MWMLRLLASASNQKKKKNYCNIIELCLLESGQANTYLQVNTDAVFHFLCFLSNLTTHSSFYYPQRSWGKVIFSEACVKNSVHRGGSLLLHAGIHPPGTRGRHPPRSIGRHPPEQTHSPRTRGRHPPGSRHPISPEQRQAPPRSKPPPTEAGTPSQEQTLPEKTPPTGPEAGTPPAQCMLGNMGNKRVVHILLECNLVSKWSNFLPIRRIGQNQPCMNRIQLHPHTSTENIVVQRLRYLTAKQVIWVQSLAKWNVL